MGGSFISCGGGGERDRAPRYMGAVPISFHEKQVLFLVYMSTRKVLERVEMWSDACWRQPIFSSDGSASLTATSRGRQDRFLRFPSLRRPYHERRRSCRLLYLLYRRGSGAATGVHILATTPTLS